MPTPVNDSHHVVRHVPKKLVQRRDGQIVGCFPQAFCLRPATATRPEEKYLSTSWKECFAGDSRAQLTECVKELRGIRDVKDKDGLAIAEVVKIKEVGTARSMRVRVLHEPKMPHAVAYTAIRGLRREDAEVFALLASQAFIETIEVSSLS